MTGVLGILVAGGGATAYVGPGDVVASAVGFWGLRAYTLASIGANCVRIIRASDSTQQDFVTVAGGGVDVASIVTFLAATTGKVVTIYDQVSTRHLTQATDANRPSIALSVLSSKPVIRFLGSGSMNLQSAAALAQSQPLTVSAVSSRTSDTSGRQIIFSGTGVPTYIGYQSAINTATMLMNGPGFVTATATDNAFHAIQFIPDSPNSTFYIDGSTTSPGDPGSQALAGEVNMGSLGGTAFFFSGDIAEIGCWGSAFSGGNQISMNSNQHSYWGF